MPALFAAANVSPSAEVLDAAVRSATDTPLRYAQVLYLPYITPTTYISIPSPLYHPCVSPISPLHLPCITPT